MKGIRYHVALDDAVLAAGFDRIRDEFDVPDEHDPAVVDEATAAARRGPLLPAGSPGSWETPSDHPYVAIDPPGARDLDQAFYATRNGTGYRIHYAIADVAAFVVPGGRVEGAALDRGVTLYAPDRRASLHPDVINEDAASLLPDVRRPAVVWTIDLDDAGELSKAHVQRANVRIQEAMTYRAAQAEIDTDPRECLLLLAEIGERRLALERQRGAVSLDLPAQEVRRDEHGHAQLVFDETLPVERWNAQISLLTGIAAADIMLDAGVGLLRTLPPADDDTIASLRRTARHLRVEWDDEQSYADRVRSLDSQQANEAALLMRSARGLRGAGYASFTNASEIPEDPQHSAIAATYSHVTAPLRRVCDRYANEIVLSICADREPPEWATSVLSDLPSVMGKTRQRERAFEKAIVDFMEVVMLEPSIGQEFDAIVVNHRRDEAIIQLRDPAVVAHLEPKRPLGEELRVRLVGVDVSARTAAFEVV